MNNLIGLIHNRINSRWQINACSFCVVGLILLLCADQSVAQLVLSPIKRTGQSSTLRETHRAARTQAVAKSLPFWDDFSFPSAIGGVQDSLWETGGGVWINNGMGIDAPSKYVATFDGLDSAGLAYSPTAVLLNGFTDTLTSIPIKLGLDEVPEAIRTTVYLSFQFQWQGNGEPPDPTDYFLLDFKNADGVWEEALKISGDTFSVRSLFHEAQVRVTGDQFFHDDFQFRFRSFGRESGPFDTWNLDYVYLNKNRNALPSSFPDRAIASGVSNLLGGYYGIPLDHFRSPGNSATLGNVFFDVKNLSTTATPVSINFNATARFTNYIGNDPLIHDETLVASQGVKGGTGIMLARERVRVELNSLPDISNPAQFDPAADSTDVTLKLRVIHAVDPQQPIYDPIDFRVNDTISQTYNLRNYYAYDDGHAEYAVYLTQSGNRALCEFDLLTHPDTVKFLSHFDVYFPDYALTSTQTISFIIYQDADDNDVPDNNPMLTLERTVTQMGLDTFFQVRFTPAIPVQRKFYVGWIAPVSGSPRVGLDYSNDTGDKIWVNTNGTWLQNTSGLHGSLMIRPFFGEGELITGIPETEPTVLIYPNPSRGEFFMKSGYDRLTIITATGQPVSFIEESLGDRTKISVVPTPGLYFVRWTKGTATRTEKVLVVR